MPSALTENTTVPGSVDLVLSDGTRIEGITLENVAVVRELVSRL